MTESQMGVKFERTCDGCTKCCEGWLMEEIYGHPMFPGQPCFYKGEGCCSIYKSRPEDPCKIFKCEWLENEDYPAWMKPSESHSLHVKRAYFDQNGVRRPYLQVLETGKPVTNEVLFFCMLEYVKTGMPMEIQVNGHIHFFGPPGWHP